MPPSGGRENRAASLPRINFQCFQTLEEEGHNERTIALTRKNALFAGSDGGGEHWATIASLVETCKLNSVEPQAWFAEVLTKLASGHPITKLDELLPWVYAQQAEPTVA